MGKLVDQIEDLRDDGVDYLRLRCASARLSAVDKLSTTLSKALGYVLFLALIFIALALFLIALSLWLGEILGHASLGFLISGGMAAIAAVAVYFAGGRLMADTLVRWFVDIFFTDDDDDTQV